MSLTFADTYNMVAYLNKSDASEGFNQVIDFLNGSYIQYALTVNPTIYVSCIKQFWNTVAVKQSNDVTRLHALVDRKKVIITEAAIRDVLRLDDAKGEALDACAALTGRVEHLEHDKVAQALEITMLKKKRIESSDDIDMEDASNQGRMIADLDRDEGIALMDDEGAEKKEKDTHVADEPDLQEVVEVVTTAKLITKVVVAVSESVSAASATIVAVPAATITTAPVRVVAASTRKRRGVVIKDPKEESTTITPAETKSKDKGKGIMVEEPKPLKKKYQVMKKRPQTEAQARRNMIMYLKNVAGFRLDYFKRMSYDDIRPIFKASSKAAKRRKLNEDVEELKQHLEIVLDEDDDVYTEATPLARKLYVSFITLMKNFDREDLESLWTLVKDRFSTSKQNNFSDDYLLTTLGAMFERSDGQAQVWKNQRTVHGQARVKSWKLLESCGVHIITFTTTQLILLVKRRYPLSRFTLDQMLNAVRLRVEEQSEMSLELLSAVKQKLMLLDTAAKRRLLLLSQVVSAAKLPILNPNEFDLWMMRIEQYFLMTDYSLWEVILNGDCLAPTRVVKGVLQPVAPTTAKQKLARKNELKARATLLMALPDKHQLKFNSHKDAKTLMKAIEKRVQKLVSQLEIHRVSLSQEDVNLKFLRTLPSEWKTHTLIWRNKADLKEQSFDDLFNSLKIYEAEVKHFSSTGTITQNLAFVSSSNTDSTTESVSAAASVFAVYTKMTVSSFPNIDSDDLKEMDLNWQMAMLTMRARRFLQRTGRNLRANGPTSLGFDMSKVKCYNCHKKGHFTRECRSPKDSKRNGAAKPQRRKKEPANYALMALSSSSSSSDTEVLSCSKACLKAYAQLHSQYDKLTADFCKSQFDVISYQTCLESVEARLLVYKQNESIFKEDIKLLKLEVQLRDNALVTLRKKLKKAEQERDDLKLKFQPSDGYHAVPPPYTGTFMPPKPDLIFNTTPTAVETNHSALTVQLSLTKPEQDLSHTNRPTTPIIEDRVSDFEDESETKAP
nr:hypothetical protein [Tanacetum cinerariifolium]